MFRELQILDQTNSDSRSKDSQIERWTDFINHWKKGLREKKDCLVLGEFNIDFMSWDFLDHFHQRLADAILEEIIPLGVSQHVQGYTKSGSGNKKTLLDHIWTSNVDMVSEAHINQRTTSDHNLVFIDYRGIWNEECLQITKK